MIFFVIETTSIKMVLYIVAAHGKKPLKMVLTKHIKYKFISFQIFV